MGPGYHSETLEHIRAITEDTTDPDVKINALRLALDLDHENGKSYAEAIKNLCTAAELPTWESHRDHFQIFSNSDTGVVSAEEIQTIALCSQTTDKLRFGAVLSLGQFGKKFRRATLSGAVELLNNPAIAPDFFEDIVTYFLEYGVAARSLLLRALQNRFNQPDLSDLMLCGIARAIDSVDRSQLSDAVDMLRNRLSSEWASISRWEIGRTLVKLAPDCIPEVIDLVAEDKTSRWELLLTGSLASPTLLIDGLRKLVRNRDTPRARREAAAALLAWLDEGSGQVAVAELRSQANDSHLDFPWRTDASSELAMADDGEVNSSLAFHRAVFDDRSQPIRDRCEAGNKIVLLDPTLADRVLHSMRAWCAEGSVVDRYTAFNWFLSKSTRSREVEQLAANLVLEPSAGPHILSSLLHWLSAADREATERRLLADRCASPAERVAGQSRWERADLADEAEAVLREVFDAEETSPGDRVEAAVALVEVSPANTAEAVDRLKSLLTDPRVEHQVRRELAKLDSGMRAAFAAEARVAFADEDEVWGSRVRAAGLLHDLIRGVSDDLAEFIREVAADSRQSATDQVDALLSLRARDGLDPVRRVRDDRRAHVAARWVAANRLRNYAVEDREAGARVLDAIATDADTRPALRWRIARDLMVFGERGRELGAAVLSALVHDHEMQSSVRSSAALHLGVSRPDLRSKMLSALRGLLTTDQPLARVQTWQVIGRFQAAEAALGLRGIARDPLLAPGVRLRAAVAMAEYNRDFRETAAVVARAVAHDPGCPLHIRVKAARALARLSDLCLDEARTLLRELGAQWPPAGNAPSSPLTR